MTQAAASAAASTDAAPVASIAARPAVERRGIYSFFEFPTPSLDLRTIATEVWLEDVCKAAWATKEAMRISAMISTHVRDGATHPMVLKDIESIMSIPKEEVNRMFKMMKLFGVFEKYDIEGPGHIVLALRLTAAQKLRIYDLKAKLEALLPTAPVDQRAKVGALRSALDVAVAPAATQPAPETPATDVTEPAATAGGGSLASRLTSLQQKLKGASDNG